MLRNALALARLVREQRCDVDPRAWPRAGLERLLRRAPDRRAVPDQLVQRLPRAERAQAPLQQRDGARRPRDRRQRPDRRADQRALRHAMGAHRGHPGQHRCRALRSGARCRGSASTPCGAAWGAQPDNQDHPGGRPHAAPQGPSRRGAGGAPAEGDGAEGFPLRLRRRGPGHSRAIPANCGIWCWRPARPTSSAWPARSTTCRPPMPPRPSWSPPRSSRKACSGRSWKREAMGRPVVVSDLGAGPGRGAGAAGGARGPHDRPALLLRRCRWRWRRP